MHLDLLMAEVEKNWPFSPKEYSQLQEMTEIDRKWFAIGHVLRHQHKSLGTIEGVFEKHEHGEHDAKLVAAMNVAAQKMFVNQLRLCALLGIGDQMLAGYVESWVAEKHPESCPTCGANMKHEGKLWRCKNCGAVKEIQF